MYSLPRQFRQEQVQEIILSVLGRANVAPIPKRISGQVYLARRILSRPLKGIIIIGGVPLLLQYSKRVSHVFQLKPCCRLPRAVEVLDVILANAFHLAVVEGSGKNAPLTGYAPVANSLIYQ
jgi:hypothetical protein